MLGLWYNPVNFGEGNGGDRTRERERERERACV